MPINRSPIRETDGPGTSNENSRETRRPGSNIDKVALRAPPFWPNEPDLWFAQLESQFTLSGVTQDSTKYAHPHRNNEHEELEHEELGERKPSQFLRHLRGLAVNIPEALLRTLWLERLPAQMQVILATRAQDHLEDIAEQADRIQEVTGRSIAEVTTTSIEKNLIEQLNKLILQVAELDKWWNQPQQRDRRRSRSREKKKTQPTICYYHRRFRDKAQKCAQPCTYQIPKVQGSH
ncbi:uncharacterized protein LOC105190096 [Harpegnathos saltator]|uniref:uncharacterized protein LOC105190096 n=1 Tax=Harpegnathos saltator TaxID=610380 RepID=UPI00058B8EAC|nr:uncharacterized protein LOC105190096 [Harpegnathos saltator]